MREQSRRARHVFGYGPQRALLVLSYIVLSHFAYGQKVLPTEFDVDVLLYECVVHRGVRWAWTCFVNLAQEHRCAHDTNALGMPLNAKNGSCWHWDPDLKNDIFTNKTEKRKWVNNQITFKCFVKRLVPSWCGCCMSKWSMMFIIYHS